MSDEVKGKVELTKQSKAFAEAAVEVRGQSAKDAGELAFLARELILATLPHSDPGDVREYERSNGHYHLVIQPGPRIGIPYGSYPRLVLAWLNTEAVRTQSPHIVLGDSLSAFMYELGLTPSWGRWGTITRLREQMKRLFGARISAVYDDEKYGYTAESMQLTRRVRLWWHPKDPEQSALWQSEVELDEVFFKLITERPVPLDMRVLKALKKSPLGLDLYAWLTYRRAYVREPVAMTWAQLHEQFGAEYALPAEFARKAKREIAKIKVYWPDLKLETPRGRLILHPGPPHVPMARKVFPIGKR